MTNLRSRLKLMSPPILKNGLRRFRELSAPPPIDDVILRDYRFCPDESERVRLNLVIPDMAPGSAFGGVLTGIEIFLRLGQAIAQRQPVDLRIVLSDSLDIAERSVVLKVAREIAFDPKDLTVATVADPGLALPTGVNDIFLPFNWWGSLNLRSLIGEQAAYYGVARRPLIYLIQEYEPQMYAFSSAHMLVREAYDGEGPLWGIFNSSLLFDYFELQGHRAARSWVFEPSINDNLRGYLANVPATPKARRIIVYGRPQVARNCFPALARGLVRWAERHPRFRDWEVISAGTAHAPIALPDGRRVSSIGKLSLGEYAELLTGSAVGVSLMASPHPSYPPIEMAHFGLRVITNGYGQKNLSDLHPNITSVSSIAANSIADALAGACDAFSADPSIAARAAPLASFLRADPYGWVRELAAEIICLSSGPAER